MGIKHRADSSFRKFWALSKLPNYVRTAFVIHMNTLAYVYIKLNQIEFHVDEANKNCQTI